MQLYNTMSRKKEDFKPAVEGKINMYACGITAYDLCHIGHARSAVVFDVFNRFFRFLGNKVTFVRNFTDVDDKIIARAAKEELSCSEISQKYIDAFHQDMDLLNVIRADIEPRATEFIQEMQNLIQRLIDKGFAYAVPDGDVYFRVRVFKDYGKLSGRDINELQAGARIAVGEKKEDPLDFALWKAAKPGEPFWDSPWGQGRPGWHLECSAMSEKTLGLPVDIHGGGQDLIFPHHENEIAQSEAATGKKLASYWVHNGFVQINSEKMSKSLGNFKTIRDILEQCQPETLRFFLLEKHYRGPLDFSYESLFDTEKGLKRIYECFRDVNLALERQSWKEGVIPSEELKEYNSFKQGVFDSLEDDLNTPAAFGHIFSIIRLINRLLETKALKNKSGMKNLLLDFQTTAKTWIDVFGLFGTNPNEFLNNLRNTKAKRNNIDLLEITSLIEKRTEARLNKDFSKSDEIRNELLQMGVEIRDTPNGVEWDII